jgi:hypothetical protein
MSKLTLEAVKQDFDSWRASRSKIGKIPDNLWAKALALLKHYPVTEIIRTLRLSGGQMKARREQFEVNVKIKKPPRKKSSSKFMEVPMPNMLAATFGTSGSESKIGLTRSDGATIIIEHIQEHTLMKILDNFIAGGTVCYN